MPRRPTVNKKWIRGPVDTLAVEQGCTFDEKAGLDVIEFIETFCRQSQGRWRGQPLKLLDWQRDYLMRLFGWKQADGLRRYRTSYLEVAKKNGKSTMVSALVLYLLLADGEGGPKVHLNAYDRQQASIVFDEARKMIEASPDLLGRLDVVDSKKLINHREGQGLIRANSADVDSKDGENPSAVIWDELHRQKTRAMWGVYRYAQVARDQPLRISITTAGEDDTGVWHEQREFSEQVNDGRSMDIAHLGVVYRALKTDDIDDPKVWAKANPSLGHTIKIEEFAKDLADAKKNPADLNDFLRFRLDIITVGSQAFLDIRDWDACADEGLRIATYRDQQCFMGLDLSSVNDLTALAIVFGDVESGIDLFTRFWLPKGNILDLSREHNVDYVLWAEQGWIELTEGNTIDYAHVRRDINEIATDSDLVMLGADPYNARQTLIQLEQSDGLPVKEVRQGFLSLSSPTKELYRLVRSGKVRHDGNPVMRWMIGNAVTETDANKNVRLSKKLSRKKIDGAAAAVNAIAMATEDEGETSVYEDRGLLFL